MEEMQLQKQRLEAESKKEEQSKKQHRDLMQVMLQQKKQQQEQMQNFQQMFILMEQQQSQIIIKLLENKTKSWPDFALCNNVVFRHMFRDFVLYTCFY